MRYILDVTKDGCFNCPGSKDALWRVGIVSIVQIKFSAFHIRVKMIR